MPFQLSAEQQARRKAYFDNKKNQTVESSQGSYVDDLGSALDTGVRSLPGIATGLGDAALGAAFGANRPLDRLSSAIGRRTGFQPSLTPEAPLTPATQRAEAAVEAAPSFGATVGAYLLNPRAIGTDIARSAAPTLAGGVGGGVTGALARSAVKRGTSSATTKALANPFIAAGAGEGAVIAGSQMDDIDPSVDPRKAGLASLGAGLGGAAIGMGGAKLASKFGVGDVDLLFQGAKGRSVLGAGETKKRLVSRILGGAATEGVFEEMPQSALEGLTTNWAEDKPLFEGLGKRAAEGLVTGMGMGALAGPFGGKRESGAEPTDLLGNQETPTPGGSPASQPEEISPAAAKLQEMSVERLLANTNTLADALVGLDDEADAGAKKVLKDNLANLQGEIKRRKLPPQIIDGAKTIARYEKLRSKVLVDEENLKSTYSESVELGDKLQNRILRDKAEMADIEEAYPNLANDIVKRDYNLLQEELKNLNNLAAAPKRKLTKKQKQKVATLEAGINELVKNNPELGDSSPLNTEQAGEAPVTEQAGEADEVLKSMPDETLLSTNKTLSDALIEMQSTEANPETEQRLIDNLTKVQAEIQRRNTQAAEGEAPATEQAGEAPDTEGASAAQAADIGQVNPGDDLKNFIEGLNGTWAGDKDFVKLTKIGTVYAKESKQKAWALNPDRTTLDLQERLEDLNKLLDADGLGTEFDINLKILVEALLARRTDNEKTYEARANAFSEGVLTELDFRAILNSVQSRADASKRLSTDQEKMFEWFYEAVSVKADPYEYIIAKVLVDKGESTTLKKIKKSIAEIKKKIQFAVGQDKRLYIEDGTTNIDYAKVAEILPDNFLSPESSKLIKGGKGAYILSVADKLDTKYPVGPSEITEVIDGQEVTVSEIPVSYRDLALQYLRDENGSFQYVGGKNPKNDAARSFGDRGQDVRTTTPGSNNSKDTGSWEGEIEVPIGEEGKTLDNFNQEGNKLPSGPARRVGSMLDPSLEPEVAEDQEVQDGTQIIDDPRQSGATNNAPTKINRRELVGIALDTLYFRVGNRTPTKQEVLEIAEALGADPKQIEPLIEGTFTEKKMASLARTLGATALTPEQLRAVSTKEREINDSRVIAEIAAERLESIENIDLNYDAEDLPGDEDEQVAYFAEWDARVAQQGEIIPSAEVVFPNNKDWAAEWYNSYQIYASEPELFEDIFQNSFERLSQIATTQPDFDERLQQATTNSANAQLNVETLSAKLVSYITTRLAKKAKPSPEGEKLLTLQQAGADQELHKITNPVITPADLNKIADAVKKPLTFAEEQKLKEDEQQRLDDRMIDYMADGNLGFTADDIDFLTLQKGYSRSVVAEMGRRHLKMLASPPMISASDAPTYADKVIPSDPVETEMSSEEAAKLYKTKKVVPRGSVRPLLLAMSRDGVFNKWVKTKTATADSSEEFTAVGADGNFWSYIKVGGKYQLHVFDPAFSTGSINNRDDVGVGNLTVESESLFGVFDESKLVKEAVANQLGGYTEAYINRAMAQDKSRRLGAVRSDSSTEVRRSAAVQKATALRSMRGWDAYDPLKAMRLRGVADNSGKFVTGVVRNQVSALGADGKVYTIVQLPNNPNKKTFVGPPMPAKGARDEKGRATTDRFYIFEAEANNGAVKNPDKKTAIGGKNGYATLKNAIQAFNKIELMPPAVVAEVVTDKQKNTAPTIIGGTKATPTYIKVGYHGTGVTPAKLRRILSEGLKPNTAELTGGNIFMWPSLDESGIANITTDKDGDNPVLQSSKLKSSQMQIIVPDLYLDQSGRGGRSNSITTRKPVTKFFILDPETYNGRPLPQNLQLVLNKFGVKMVKLPATVSTGSLDVDESPLDSAEGLIIIENGQTTQQGKAGPSLIDHSKAATGLDKGGAESKQKNTAPAREGDLPERAGFALIEERIRRNAEQGKELLEGLSKDQMKKVRKKIRGIRSSLTQQPVTQASTTAAVLEALKKYAPTAAKNKIRVVQNWSELEDYLIRNDVAPSMEAGGFVHNGNVFFIADNIQAGTEGGVIMHEIGVHINMSPHTIRLFAESIRNMAASNPNAQYALDAVDASMAAMLTTNGKVSRFDVDHEVVAYFVEQTVNSGLEPTQLAKKSGALGNFFRRLLAVVRRTMAAMGFKSDSLTSQDIVDAAWGAADTVFREPVTKEAVRMSLDASVKALGRSTDAMLKNDSNGVENMFSSLSHYTRKYSAPFTFSHDIQNLAEKYLPSSVKYFDASTQAAYKRGQFTQETAQALKGAETFTKKQREEVNKYLLDSQTIEAWGFEENFIGKVEPLKIDESKGGLRERYEAMTQTQQKVIFNVFKVTARQRKEQYDTLRGQIESTGQELLSSERDPAKKDVIEAELEQDLAAFDAVTGPQRVAWLHLNREGDYAVIFISDVLKAAMDESSVNDKEVRELKKQAAHYRVEFVSNDLAARTRATELQKEVGEAGKVNHFLRNNLPSTKDSIPFYYLNVLRANTERDSEFDEFGDPTGNSITASAQMKSWNKSFLISLSENSSRKAELERVNIAGADADMLNAFTKYSTSLGGTVAGIEFGRQTTAAIQRMRDEQRKASDRSTANVYLNQILAKQAQDLSVDSSAGTGINRVLASTSFFMLLTSPAYYMINSTQPWMLTLPHIAGQFNNLSGTMSKMTEKYKIMRKAWRAEHKGNPFTKFKGELADIEVVISQKGEDYRELMDSLVRKGLFDIGLDSDMGSFTGETNVIGRAHGFFTHAVRSVEVFNRGVTALTAYEMAKQNPFKLPKITDPVTQQKRLQSPIEYAIKEVIRTQGDYSAGNAPTIINKYGGLTKIATQFRKFQLIQISLLMQMAHASFFGATKEEKAVGRRQLGYVLSTHGVAGGLLGLPMMNLAGYVVASVFGDEDEPANFEVMIRKQIGNDALADLFLKGLPAMAGVDISSRVGMGHTYSLMPFTDLSLSRDGMTNGMLALFGGPTAAQVILSAGGVDMMLNGDYLRGAVDAMPKGIKQVGRALLQNKNGIQARNAARDTLMSAEELSLFDDFSVAIGLPSTKITDMQTTNRWLNDMKMMRAEKISRMKGEFVRAFKDNDYAAQMEIREDWRRFNNQQVKLGYKYDSPKQLMEAVKLNRRNERRVKNGVRLTKEERQGGVTDILLGLD